MKYFEEHREDYRIPEKVKIAYIAVRPDQFKDKVKPDEQEIKLFYDDNLDMFTQSKEVRARHILFRLNPDASEEDEKKVREKALSVLERAQGGEDFSKLAKEFSEGPTNDRGGDLGYFPKGRMIKEFEDAAFNLEKGSISNLVRTAFGYHIIKVEDIRDERIKKLEEVRDQILDILIRNESISY